MTLTLTKTMFSEIDNIQSITCENIISKVRYTLYVFMEPGVTAPWTTLPSNARLLCCIWGSSDWGWCRGRY